MTREEKFQAILSRAKKYEEFITPDHISIVMITSYIDDLTKHGLIANRRFSLSGIGKDLTALCDEFDWQPTDTDINQFVEQMVDPQDQEKFSTYLFRYRDDRAGLLEDIKKKKYNNEYPENED